MVSIYELYGRQAEKLEQAKEMLGKTLGLLKAIQDGEVNLSDVVISENGWQYKPKEEGKEKPA